MDQTLTSSAILDHIHAVDVPSVLTAETGIITAGSGFDCVILTVANCPGFKSPSLFSTSASTVIVLEVALTFGDMRTTVPAKLRSG